MVNHGCSWFCLCGQLPKIRQCRKIFIYNIFSLFCLEETALTVKDLCQKHKTGSYSKEVNLWIFINQLQSENINFHALEIFLEIFEIWSFTNLTQKLFLPKMNFQNHVSDKHPQSWVTNLTQKLFLLQIFVNKHKTGSYSKEVTLWILIKQVLKIQSQI